MSDFVKIRENRLRRMARRRGIELRKSRTRDQRALDFGKWRVVEIDRNFLLAECDNLDEVEAWLNN